MNGSHKPKYFLTLYKMYATTYGIKIEFSSIFLLLIFRRLLFIYYCQNIAQKLIFYFPGRIWPWKSEAERIKLHIERVSLKVASFIMVLSDIFLTYLCHSALHSIIFPHTVPEQKYFFLILWAFKGKKLRSLVGKKYASLQFIY